MLEGCGMSEKLENGTFSTATLSKKLSVDSVRETYIHDMESSSSQKSATLQENFPTNLSSGDIIVDCGTSSGAIPKSLKDAFPQQFFIGLDLSLQMLLKAKSNNPEIAFVQADIFKLPFKNGTVKVFLLSSVLHELFSYADSPYSSSIIISVLSMLYELLAEGGRIIIKDPAKPANPTEILLFKLDKSDGFTTTDAKKLLEIPPKELSTFSRYLRFQYQFRPELLNGLNTTNDLVQGFFSAPAWYLSEFIRHRNLADTTDHWNSEMVEHYGVFTEEEFREVCRTLNFNCVKVETSFDVNNHANIKRNEILIWTQDHQVISQAERFPMGITVVIEK